LVADAIRAGIFNDLGSGSNVDLTAILRDGTVNVMRNYDKPNPKPAMQLDYTYKRGTTGMPAGTRPFPPRARLRCVLTQRRAQRCSRAKSSRCGRWPSSPRAMPCSCSRVYRRAHTTPSRPAPHPRGAYRGPGRSMVHGRTLAHLRRDRPIDLAVERACCSVCSANAPSGAPPSGPFIDTRVAICVASVSRMILTGPP
jgi:hypothetical protein